MNCDLVQRHLLGRERPDKPSADAVAHLADCAACREWLQRLLQLERAAIHLPVPPAEAARSALIRRILTQKAGNGQPAKEKHRPSIAMVIGSWIMDPHASPRRRAAAGLVAGVAAALLLFITGWLVWDGTHPQQNQMAIATARVAPDPLLADLSRHGINLGGAAKGGARVRAMADAAETLRDRCQEAARAGSHKELGALAELYTRVVTEGVVQTAEGLSREDLQERRDDLGKIAAELGNADSQLGGLATFDMPERVKTELKKAATAARTAKTKLEELSA